MRRESVIIVLSALVTLAYVIYVNRGINGFTLWNLLPIFIAMISLLVDKSMTGLRYAIYGFACTIIMTIFVVHVGYHINIGKALSIPLLSGKKIYGLPLYSVGAGYVVGMIGIVIGTVQDGNAEKRHEKPM
ncbi:hypothetical protein ACFL2P_00225 [Candidatus Moduliflexota bacterium]